MRTALERAFDTPGTKQRYVRRLFATIAPRYDLITRVLSFGLDRGWKTRLIEIADVRPGTRLLDLACGTGDLAFEGARRGASAVGLDITPGMIDLARAKPGASGLAWLVGDMAALPVASGSFDLVTTGYGLRNTSDLTGALADIHRVLRPGGRLCSLDFDRPESAPVRGAYLDIPHHLRIEPGFRAARRSRYVPLHSGVDPAVSRARAACATSCGPRDSPTCDTSACWAD